MKAERECPSFQGLDAAEALDFSRENPQFAQKLKGLFLGRILYSGVGMLCDDDLEGVYAAGNPHPTAQLPKKMRGDAN